MQQQKSSVSEIQRNDSTGHRKQRRRLTPRTRLVFGVLILLLATFACEVIAFIGCSVAHGTLATWHGLQTERHGVLASLSDAHRQLDRPVEPHQDQERGEVAARNEVVHPFIGYVAAPDSGTASFSNADAHVTELGFPSLRSASFERSSDDDFIICVTGGSLAKWFALDGAAELVSELQSHTAFASRNIIVCGLANGGYKQPQQVMAVNYILSLGAEFDVLVNIDGFNEVALHESENLPGGVHPAFPRQWHLRVGSLPTPELLRLAGRADLAQQQRIDFAAHYSRGLKQYSMLCNLWWTFRDRSLTKQYQELLHEFRRFRSENHEYAQTGPAWHAADEQNVYQSLAGMAL